MNTEPRTALFLETADEVLRSWWLIPAGVCLGLAAGMVIVNFMPITYDAEARIDVEWESVSDLITSTVSDDIAASLTLLRRLVFGPSSLSGFAEQEFGGPPPAGMDRYATALSASTSVFYRRGDTHFTIVFRDTNPLRAQRAANAIARAYVQENGRLRVASAEDTTRTLEQLSQAVLEQLQAQEAAIAEFEARNPRSSSEQLPFNLQALERVQTDLDDNLVKQTETRKRLDAFKSQKEQEELIATFSAPGTGPVQVQSAESNLARLQRELQDRLLKYSKNHPDVKRLQRQIAELKARPPEVAQSEPDGDRAPRRPTVTVWDADIMREQRALEKLESEEKRLRSDIEQYRQRVEATPRTKRTVDDLAQGLQAKQQEYDVLQRKIASAKSAQLLEADQKGMRFVVTPAVLPSAPVSPQPIPIYGMGIAGGLVLFLAPLLTIRLLNPRVNSELSILEISQVPVSASIPRIATPATVRLDRRRRMRNVGFSLISVAILVTVVIGLG